MKSVISYQLSKKYGYRDKDLLIASGANLIVDDIASLKNEINMIFKS